MSVFSKFFTSRKFLAAVGGFITAVAAHNYGAAASILVAYIAAEAHVDAKAAAANTSHTSSYTDNSAPAVDQASVSTDETAAGDGA